MRLNTGIHSRGYLPKLPIITPRLIVRLSIYLDRDLDGVGFRLTRRSLVDAYARFGSSCRTVEVRGCRTTKQCDMGRSWMRHSYIKYIIYYSTSCHNASDLVRNLGRGRREFITHNAINKMLHYALSWALLSMGVVLLIFCLHYGTTTFK